MMNTTIKYNYAGKNGGGLFWLYGVIKINTTLFYNNVAKGFSGHIFAIANSIINVTDSVFKNNYTDIFASLFINHENDAILNYSNRTSILSDYRNSSTSTKGDFIYVQLGTVIHLDNNTFDNNYGDLGTAIYSESDVYLYLSNSVFTNLKANIGAAIYSYLSGYIEIKNCTFYNNSASQANDIFISQTKTRVNLINNSFFYTISDKERVYLTGLKVNIINNSIFGKNPATKTNTGQGFNLQDNIDVVIDNLIILNTVSKTGGAILIQKTIDNLIYTVKINNLICRYNIAYLGGCIAAYSISNITIKNSIFDNNQAFYYQNNTQKTEISQELSGGAIYYFCDKIKNTRGVEVCSLYFSENVTFINNFSKKIGGAINWLYIEPIFYNKTTGNSSINFINNTVINIIKI